MKTLIAIALACMLAVEVPAQTDPKPTGAVLAVLVVSAAIVGIYIIVKVNATCPDRTGTVTLVLERSPDCKNWVPVATNTVTLNGVKPIDCFCEPANDPLSFYRCVKAK
jgi:hypothetical protein